MQRAAPPSTAVWTAGGGAALWASPAGPNHPPGPSASSVENLRIWGSPGPPPCCAEAASVDHTPKPSEQDWPSASSLHGYLSGTCRWRLAASAPLGSDKPHPWQGASSPPHSRSLWLITEGSRRRLSRNQWACAQVLAENEGRRSLLSTGPS